MTLDASDPAFVSGTSAEFLGAKPLPRATRGRPLLFVLGPRGAGKSSVARRILGQGALELSDADLSAAVAERPRRRAWSPLLVQAPALILDGPCFLERRPGVVRALAELLSQRARDGLRTAVTDPDDGSALRALADAVEVKLRATVLLRFPVGRGRRRFATQICDELGLDRALARGTASLEPWSYGAVRALLLESQPPKP